MVHQATPQMREIFEDLSSRFILSLPEEELSSFERILFHVEAAHWFYEDNFQEDFRQLPSLSFKDFAVNMFASCPLLAPYRNGLEKRIEEWRDYKSQVPVYGVILLNPALDKVLLVRGWKGKAWGFPKGKINKNESEIDCAIREAFEEIGFDVSSYIHEENHIEKVSRGQATKLYIIPGVPESTKFETHTKKEIGAIEWQRLDELPTLSDKQNGTVPSSGKKPNQYFMCLMFVQDLRNWVKKQKKGGDKKKQKQTKGKEKEKDNASKSASKKDKETKPQQSDQKVQTAQKAQGSAAAPIRILRNESPVQGPTTQQKGASVSGPILLNFKFDTNAIFTHL